MAVTSLPRTERNSPEVERLYAALPEGSKASIIRGHLCMAPAPRPRHQRCVWQLGTLLAPYDQSAPESTMSQRWYFLHEPELHLGSGPDKFQPDIVGWFAERASFGADDSSITIRPNWVCEVLSPSTEVFDRATKAPLYAEHRIDWLWLISPEDATIEVFANDGALYRPVKTLTPVDTSDLTPAMLAPFEQLTVAGLARMFSR